MSFRRFARSIRPTASLAALSLAVVTSACGRRPSDGGAEAPQGGSAAPAPAATGTDGAAAGAAQAAPAKVQLPAAIMVKDAGLATPESVLYDPEEDLYLVSNINGSPTEPDANGFISKVGPDGKVIELKWIDGAKKGVNLNAPKGMTFKGALLYVADINFVRVFDRKTGKPMGKLAVPKATFANALATAPDGTVYISDSGLKVGKDGFEGTGTDSLQRMGKSTAFKPLVESPDLGRPNGLLADDDGVWCVTFGTGELVRVGKDGKKTASQTLPKGGLDGIVKLTDGSIAVSSWNASAVFRGKPGGDFTPLIENVKSPAGIGYDSKRNRILIPVFQENAVWIQPLPELPAIADPVAAAPPPPPPASAAPATPAQGGAQPATPAKAATPAKGGAQPATPATPAAPAKGAAQPATPAKGAAAQPAKPAPQAAPAKGAAQPAKPATPAAPAKGETQPAKPATPATPAKK